MHFLTLALLATLSRADIVGTPHPSAPAEAPDTLRTFTETDSADLAARLAKELRKCKQLKKGAETNIAFSNRTEEYIDGNAFAQSLRAQLPPAAGGPGKKYDLAVRLSSRISQTGDQYDAVYTVDTDVKQADEVLCKKSEKLEKKGTVKKVPAPRPAG
jgi:hypothetical protein